LIGLGGIVGEINGEGGQIIDFAFSIGAKWIIV
jgi:hypothetical protein